MISRLLDYLTVSPSCLRNVRQNQWEQQQQWKLRLPGSNFVSQPRCGQEDQESQSKSRVNNNSVILLKNIILYKYCLSRSSPAASPSPPAAKGPRGPGGPSSSRPAQGPRQGKKKTAGRRKSAGRRYRAGTRALMEIRSVQVWQLSVSSLTSPHLRKYQKSTNLLIPKLPFSRVIREICQQVRLARVDDTMKLSLYPGVFPRHEVPDRRPHGPPGSRRGLHGDPLRGQTPLYHSCQAGDADAEGHGPC